MNREKTYQKIISLLTISLLSVPPAAVSAYTTELEIEQRGNEAFITAYTGDDANIVCPDNWLGFPVTTIDEGAFADRSIESIVLPQNLKTIYTEAFRGSTIYEINLPGSTKTVWHGAFMDSTLETINGEENLTMIGDSAFMNTRLTSVDLSSCKEIQLFAFLDSQLEEVVWPQEEFNAGISAFAGNHLKTADLRNLKGAVVVDSMLQSNELTHVQLPENYLIRAGAFNDNQFPDEAAFFYETADSTKLASYGGARRSEVVIPDRTTCIGDSAFLACGIESVKIPDTVTELQQYCFYDNKLTSVTIPNGVTHIDRNVFAKNQLTSITIPPAITTIDAQAFQNNNLSSVTIPSTVTAIGANAFSGNPNLKTIYMEGRSDLSDMTLGRSWNGEAEIVFGDPGPDPSPIPDETTAEVAVNGTIAAVTSLDIDVPLQLNFSIDANRQFISNFITIRNNSPFPVTATAVSLTHKESSPPVVDPFKFTPEQWADLNGEETAHNIAFGLHATPDTSGSTEHSLFSDTQWFRAEGTDSNLNLGVIPSKRDNENTSQLVLSLDSYYGRVWGDTTNISYTLTLSFAVE